MMKLQRMSGKIFVEEISIVLFVVVFPEQ